jgi:hypothetical protein
VRQHLVPGEFVGIEPAQVSGNFAIQGVREQAIALLFERALVPGCRGGETDTALVPGDLGLSLGADF